MYAQGYRVFSEAFPRQELTGELRPDLRVMLHYFVRFCAADPARYQLMFQRTIPGFEPTPESFALSLASLTEVADHLARCGVTGPRAIDLYTALGTGLADQQISHDPGGDRWIGLIDEAVEMVVGHLTRANGPGPTLAEPSPSDSTPSRCRSDAAATRYREVDGRPRDRPPEEFSGGRSLDTPGSGGRPALGSAD